MIDRPNPAGSFFEELLRRQPSLGELPIVDRVGSGWRSQALTVPPPSGSDLAGPLDIEVMGEEVTISLDQIHILMTWTPEAPGPAGVIWVNPLAMVEAIVDERVLATSGWIDGLVRIGSLQVVGNEKPLLMSNLQRQRWRSWRGTFDQDEVLS